METFKSSSPTHFSPSRLLCVACSKGPSFGVSSGIDGVINDEFVVLPCPSTTHMRLSVIPVACFYLLEVVSCLDLLACAFVSIFLLSRWSVIIRVMAVDPFRVNEVPKVESKVNDKWFFCFVYSSFSLPPWLWVCPVISARTGSWSSSSLGK